MVVRDYIQTFSVSEDTEVKNIKIKGWRDPKWTPDLTITIRQYPYFPDYDAEEIIIATSVLILNSTISTTTPTWINATLTEPTILLKCNLYTINEDGIGIMVFGRPIKMYNFYWRVDKTLAEYSTGSAYSLVFYPGKGLTGPNWIALENQDFMFEIWGTIMPNYCTTTLVEVNNTTTGASFWIDKSITYGDLLITILLCIFLIFGAIKFLTDLEIPKRMNFKR